MNLDALELGHHGGRGNVPRASLKVQTEILGCDKVNELPWERLLLGWEAPR